MAQVTEINVNTGKKAAPKGRLKAASMGRIKKVKSKGEFSTRERLLITATSIVAFGGVVFCTVMIILMTSIDY